MIKTEEHKLLAKDFIHPQSMASSKQVQVIWSPKEQSFFYSLKGDTRKIRMFSTDHWEEQIKSNRFYSWSPRCKKCEKYISVFLTGANIKVICEC